MDSIATGFERAFSLLIGLDPELLGIVFLSLKVSGTALLIGSVTGLSVGAFTGLKSFPGRGLAITLLNTCMGLPPVIVGLFLYLLLSRRGPLGFMAFLYSPTAMIIAQSILAFPIVAALSHAAVAKVDPLIRQASLTLGATSLEAAMTVMREARYGIAAAVIAAFGRVLGEVGAILIVGGNIAHYTRVMTTAIALETDKGNFELAIALGIVLLLLSFTINIGLYAIQRKGMVHSQG